MHGFLGSFMVSIHPRLPPNPDGCNPARAMVTTYPYNRHFKTNKQHAFPLEFLTAQVQEGEKKHRD
jgi:hypothetical protein